MDWQDSARFTSIFQASGFFCSQTFYQPARQPLTQTVGQPIKNMNILSRIYATSRKSINELPNELLEYLPTSKWDPERIQRLSQLDQTKRKVLLPYLLVWVQDINWPNAGKIAPFLIAGGQEIVPEIEWVLNGQDDIWKGNCIRHLLTHLSPETVQPLLPILKRIAEAPTANEKAEEIDVDAATCIEQLYLS